MRVEGKVVVVTGGAAGIGEAMCRRFVGEGARAVVVADLDAAGAERVAAEIGGTPVTCDVGREADLLRLVDEAERRHGPIDLFCSNAGVAPGFDPLADNAGGAPDEAWDRGWRVNVMAHVWAARALVPRMRARGGGYLLQTISAAGLLSQVGSPVYATTKHAAVGFAESVAIAHRAHGIGVSIVCPQGVDTPMLRALPSGPQSWDGVLSADAVADAVVAGLAAETFLILPHPKVKEYVDGKAADYDRWLRGMARLQERVRDEAGRA